MPEPPVIIIDPGVRDQLNQLGQRMSDMEPVMAEIGEIVQASIQQNFQEEGRPNKWEPLSDVTKKIRRALGRGRGRILNRSGATGLFGSINYQADKDSVAIGTNKIYARMMQEGARKGQFGTVTVRIKAHVRKVRGKNVRVKAHTRKQQIPWGDVPGRPFLMIQEEDWQDIGETLDEYLMGENT